MNKSNDLLDPGYQELNKIWFTHRTNHYKRMIQWLVVVNTVAWSAVAYIVIKWWSI